MKHICELCRKEYSSGYILKRHINSIHGERVLCDICGKYFCRKDAMLAHKRKIHSILVGDENLQCVVCQKVFARRDRLLYHLQKQHVVETKLPAEPEASKMFCVACKKEILISNWHHHLRTNIHKKNSTEPLNEHLKIVKSVFQERIETYVYENKNEEILDPLQFFDVSKEHILSALEDLLKKHSSFKFNIELFGEYMKITNDENDITISIKSFQSAMKIIQKKDDLARAYMDAVDIIHKKMQEFQERDSGWTLIRIIHIEINVNQYKPLRGSQYLPLPKSINEKKACINIKNDDEYCFKWAVISALYPAEKNSDRVSSYKVENIESKKIMLKNNIEIDFGELEFPLQITDIDKFEKLNPNISVNVFGLSCDERDSNKCKIIGPFHTTSEEKVNHINLLLIQEEEKCHYVWIKNISR